MAGAGRGGRLGVRFTLVGVGAMNSPCYRPAGLLVRWPGNRVLLDAGEEAALGRRLGGHAAVLRVAEAARDHKVSRLVFAHIGRPSIRAIDRGERPPFGEWGVEGRTYRL